MRGGNLVLVLLRHSLVFVQTLLLFPPERLLDLQGIEAPQLGHTGEGYRAISFASSYETERL